MSQIRKVVEALMKHGPKYTTISRETGVPITTVRYILKEKLPKLGFRLHAAINYGKLGLQRYLVMIETSLSPDHMSGLLDLFGEMMYLNYYTYLLNEKKFLTIFSIPPKFEDSFITFLDELVKLSIIKKYDFKRLQYRRVVPLRVECFDFDKGVWKQNWEDKPRAQEVPEIYEDPREIIQLNSIDLEILTELHKNSLMRYTDIARRLTIARQTVKRHYEKILQLIYLYMLFWMPTEHPELVCTPIFIQTYSSDETRKALLDIPFTHLEMKSEDSDYYTILFVPSLGFYSVLRYISERTPSTKIDFLSMEYAANFVLPHNLFVDKEGWLNMFDFGIQKILKEVRLPDRSF